MKLTQETIKQIIKEELENVLNEDLPDCPTNTMKLSDLFAAAVLSSATEEEKRQLYDLAATRGNDVLQKISDSLEVFTMKKARVEKWGNVTKIASLFSAAAVTIGVMIPTLPIIGAATLAAGGAGLIAGTALTGTVADVVSGMLMGKEEQQLLNNPSAKQLMKLFCIDMKLLALLDNGVQAKFIKESELKKEIVNFFDNSSFDTELPDLNNTLIEWINSKQLARTKVEPK